MWHSGSVAQVSVTGAGENGFAQHLAQTRESLHLAGNQVGKRQIPASWVLQNKLGTEAHTVCEQFLRAPSHEILHGRS